MLNNNDFVPLTFRCIDQLIRITNLPEQMLLSILKNRTCKIHLKFYCVQLIHVHHYTDESQQ